MEKIFNLNKIEKEKIINKIKKILIPIKDISFTYIFGSFNQEYFKDIDVSSYCLIDKEKVFDFEIAIALKLEKEINIPVDFKILNYAPLGFQVSVINEGFLLFEKDKDFRLNYIENLGIEYLDYFEFSKNSLKELAQCIKK